MTGKSNFWSDTLSDFWTATNPIGRDAEGEHNMFDWAGFAVTYAWNAAPASIKVTAFSITATYGAIFDAGGQASNGFTMRDGFQLAGGIIGGFAGIIGGGGLGSAALGFVGTQVGGWVGGELYDLMFDADATDIRARVSDIDFNNHPAVVTKNSDGSETHNHTDPKTGQQVQTRVIVDPQTGQKTGVYSTVIDPTSPLRGMTYPVTAVQNGYELNALDRISEESHARALVKKAQEEAAAIARAKDDRDRQGGGSSSSSSGSSSNSNNGRVHIPPGTPNDVRLPGVSYGGQDADARREGGAHGTPTFDNHADRLGFPIVIDLDGDGVEISPLGGSTARFDYDNDGFKELTAWVGKDDGLLVYDIGNDGLISETREVVIAEWTADKTDTDLDALKAVYFNAGRRGRGANWNSRPRLKAAA